MTSRKERPLLSPRSLREVITLLPLCSLCPLWLILVGWGLLSLGKSGGLV